VAAHKFPEGKLPNGQIGLTGGEKRKGMSTTEKGSKVYCTKGRSTFNGTDLPGLSTLTEDR